MALRKPLKIVLGVLIVPPIFLVLIILFALFWPTEPLPVEEVFLGACGVDFKEEYIIGERPHSFSIAPQGVWYDESSSVKVTLDVAAEIHSLLSSNPDYEFTDGYFKKFIVGKVLAICSIDLTSGQITYNYVLW